MNKLIPENELVHGTYYYGHCRNGSTARWDANNKVFIYWRHKFGDRFLETICHPERDKEFDVFFPYEVVDWGTPAIPLIQENS